MTNEMREAFERNNWNKFPIEYWHTENGEYTHPQVISTFNDWQAACKWQREKDAKICEEAGDTPEDSEARGVYLCENLIRNQEKK